MKNLESIRSQFPALQSKTGGVTPLFLDGPGGSQVPQRVGDAITEYLFHHNANHGGVFSTSRESDRMLVRAHEGVARFLNARSADEIVFGANMTTLTLHLSRAISRTLAPGDEVIVTRLDHDANVSPWVLAARDAGASIRKIDINPEDCTLNLNDLREQLTSRTKLVAVGAASNLVGSLTDIREVTRLAHAKGALVFVDAVHAAPHIPIDVQAWGCDFLACSAYKFFGPHVSMLWGRRELLESLPAYKLRPATDALPDRWETGTLNHEGIAGVLAALEYIGEIGMAEIQAYEAELAVHLLEELNKRPQFKVHGIASPDRVNQRTPTIAITSEKYGALDLARHLAERQIYAWSGNCYALELTERLGLEESQGPLRLGLMHYNTHEEITRLIEALDELS